MGLDLLPYLENHAILVAHNNKVFKLKINYKDDIRPQDKSDFADSVSRQDAHDQVEEVLRAVLYILERDRLIHPIQTHNFVVHPKTVPWVLANRIEFFIDEKVLYCYPDCLILEVHCKPLISDRNHDGASTVKSRELDNNLSLPPKEKDGQNNCVKDGERHANKFTSPETSKPSLPGLRTRSQSKNAENCISPLSMSVVDQQSGNKKKIEQADGVLGRSHERKTMKNSSAHHQSKSVENSDVINKNPENSGGSDVIETAKNCIKKHRIERTASLRNKDKLLDKRSDSNSNANDEIKGSSVRQNGPSSKRQLLGSGVNSFDMPDSDMVELHQTGSIIISQTDSALSEQSRTRKRRIDSPEKKESSKGKKVLQETCILRSSSQKKTLYSANDSFATTKNIHNWKTHQSKESVKLSRRAQRHNKQKFVNEYKYKQKQHSFSSTRDSSSESSSSEMSGSPQPRENNGAKEIVRQYKNLMENSLSPQTKCGPKGDRFGFKVVPKNTKTVNSKMDCLELVKDPNCNVKRTPQMSSKSSYQQLSEQVPVKGTRAAYKKGTDQNSQSFASSQRLSDADGQGDKNVSSASRRSARTKQDSQDPPAVKSSVMSLPQRRKRYNIARKARSDSKLREFRLTRSRLLAGKDGVWLLPTTLFSHDTSTRKKEPKRRTQSSLKSHEQDCSPSLSQRTGKSTSSPCLTTPDLFTSPDSSRKLEEKDQRRRPGRPSKFFKVLTSIFATSSSK